jgi:hypothetical protein
MDSDERGFRVALVADELVNPAPGGVDVLAVLERSGWGVIQLPPAWYPDDVAAPLLNQVAEHVDEFARHGYKVVLIGGRAGLTEALAGIGIAVPDAIVPGTASELQAFLSVREAVEPRTAAPVTRAAPSPVQVSPRYSE